MKKLSIIILLLSYFCAHGSTDEEEIYKLLRGFNQLSTAYVLCMDETTEHNTKPSLKEDYKKWFTASTAGVFGSICDYPIVIYDIRYGIGGQNDLEVDYNNDYDKKVRQGLKLYFKSKPKINNDTAQLQVTYDFLGAPYKYFGNYIYYTLKRENDRWLIYDMATGGNSSRQMNWGEGNVKSVRSLISKAAVAAKKEERKKITKSK